MIATCVIWCVMLLIVSNAVTFGLCYRGFKKLSKIVCNKALTEQERKLRTELCNNISTVAQQLNHTGPIPSNVSLIGLNALTILANRGVLKELIMRYEARDYNTWQAIQSLKEMESNELAAAITAAKATEENSRKLIRDLDQLAIDFKFVEDDANT